MYYIGLDVHKQKISYCVKDSSGKIYAEGWIPATRFDLDRWMKTLPQPWKALKDFPKMLDRIAAEIQLINKADPLFYARRRGNGYSSRSALLRLQQRCIELPRMIQGYAEALRERNAAVASATPRSGSLNALIELTEAVKYLTGNHHDKEVSELLNTIARALGVRKRFDALSIAQARSRHRKKKT
jgi:hypothetical protein